MPKTKQTIVRLLVFRHDAAGKLMVLVGITRSGEHQFPGGKREKRETAAKAAARELHEETGVVIAPRKLKPLAKMDDTHTKGEVIVVFVALDDGKASPGNSRELNRVRYVPVADVTTLNPPLTKTCGLLWRMLGHKACLNVPPFVPETR